MQKYHLLGCFFKFFTAFAEADTEGSVGGPPSPWLLVEGLCVCGGGWHQCCQLMPGFLGQLLLHNYAAIKKRFCHTKIFSAE
jgi:hypothetical protein